jgi:hypothetical protein
MRIWIEGEFNLNSLESKDKDKCIKGDKGKDINGR